MKKRILAITGALAVLCAGIYFYGAHMAQRLPDNSPAAFLKSNPDRTGKKVVVCVGDSITHGRVSHNYVDMTAGKLSDRGFIVVNAGVNSELAYNVLSRIDEIIRCTGTEVDIALRIVDDIPLTSAGKHQVGVRSTELSRGER